MRLFKRKKKNNKVKGWLDIDLVTFTQIEKILADDQPAKAERLQQLIYGEKGDIKFLNEEPPKVMWEKKYWINGNRYRLQADMSHFTLSQQIDLQTAKSFIDRMSVLLVPIQAKTYNDGYDMEEVRKDLEKMRIVDAMAISVFLMRQCVVLQLLMNDSLGEKMKTLEKSGALSETQKNAIRSQYTAYSTLCNQFAKNLTSTIFK